jgi:hypothetical protein
MLHLLLSPQYAFYGSDGKKYFWDLAPLCSERGYLTASADNRTYSYNSEWARMCTALPLGLSHFGALFSLWSVKAALLSEKLRIVPENWANCSVFW